MTYVAIPAGASSVTISASTPQPIGTVGAAGSSGEVSDADHVHAGAYAPGGGRRLLLSNAAGDGVTDSGDATWHDTNKTLTLSGADADQVINATSGNAQLDFQKNGTSWLKIRTGSSGLNFDFLSSGSANNFTIPGASSTLGFSVGGAERFLIKATGDLVVGNGDTAQTSLATNVTAGFLRLPGCAGTPTGAAVNGSIVVDTSGSKLFVRLGGAWVSTTLA